MSIFLFLSIALLCAQRFLASDAAVSFSAQDVGELHCSRICEMAKRSANQLAYESPLIKVVRKCITSVNNRECHLCNVIKSNNEQLAVYNSALKAQEVFNKNITEQFAMLQRQFATLSSNYTEKINQMTALQNAVDSSNSIINLDCQPFGNASGIHTFKVPGIHPFNVACDSRFAGPGWTVILRRVDGSVDFNWDWEDYKNGFGDLNGNIWLGLEKMHRLTASQPHELYIHMESFTNKTTYARYDSFMIGKEEQQYELKSVGKYTGDGEDSLRYNEKMKFTTRDRDNDLSPDFNCAMGWNGGWWWNACSFCLLTVPYKVVQENKDFTMGILQWYNYKSLDNSIKFVQMMIRPLLILNVNIYLYI